MNSDVWLVLIITILKLAHLRTVEESCWLQIYRIRSLKEGDQDTFFFHKVTQGRSRVNFFSPAMLSLPKTSGINNIIHHVWPSVQPQIQKKECCSYFWLVSGYPLYWSDGGNYFGGAFWREWDLYSPYGGRGRQSSWTWWISFPVCPIFLQPFLGGDYWYFQGVP